MADINVSVTVPAVITATATDPNHITVAVTTPTPITVSASVGNSGDMMKSVYDTDNSGVVDNAAALGGIAPTGFVQTADTSWIDLTDGGQTTLHSHAGGSGTVTSIATTAPITGGTITGSGTIGIDAATTLAAGSMSASDKSKLDGIEAGAEVNNISDVNATDLTDGGATSLHSHANDHARQHSITSTSDHTSAATSGQMLKADANGLPVNATNTDAQVSAAVTASHAAVTVADTASIDMSLTGQQISAAAIFGTSATTIAQGNHTHASPANVDPSVADNFVSFSNTTGAQKDSGKGLTHLVYTLQCGTGANFTANDSTTYFFGGSLTTNTGTVRSGIYIPLAGTIVSVDVVVFVGAVLATTETSSIYLRLNDTTDTTISSGVQANTQLQRYQANTSIAVSAGDFIEWKWVTPAWATNPTNVRVYGVAMVRV